MKPRVFSRLSNASLLDEFAARLARERESVAELVACLAEVDHRKLFLPAGYRSMYAYCVGHFHLSEAAAYKRIHVGRLTRRYPAVYTAFTEGRVHLSGLLLLVPHAKPENIDELLEIITHKSRKQIEQLLAERFPKRDVAAVVVAIAATPTVPEPNQLAPGQVSDIELTPGGASSEPSTGDQPMYPPAPERQAMEGELAQRVSAPQPGSVVRPRVSPLSATRYAVQFTMDAASHELLERAQALLGHRVAPGDIADVLGRALRAYVALLERAKFAATSRPHAHPRRTGKDSRHIPAHVQRAVWERDGGQCTFIGDSGHRCEERADLEFDHVQEYACDGEASVGSIRLLCRAHNQFAAEKAFGLEFMRHKREKALAARSGRSA